MILTAERWTTIFKVKTKKSDSDKLCYMYQFRTVAQSCPTLCDATNRFTPGLPVHHQLPESTQTYLYGYLIVSQSVSSVSQIRLFASPWITASQAFLSITNSRSSLKLTSIESVMPSSHLILCRSLLLRPPIPPSIRVFSNESTLHMRWPKYWSFLTDSIFCSV